MEISRRYAETAGTGGHYSGYRGLGERISDFYHSAVSGATHVVNGAADAVRYVAHRYGETSLKHKIGTLTLPLGTAITIASLFIDDPNTREIVRDTGIAFGSAGALYVVEAALSRRGPKENGRIDRLVEEVGEAEEMIGENRELLEQILERVEEIPAAGEVSRIPTPTVSIPEEYRDGYGTKKEAA